MSDYEHEEAEEREQEKEEKDADADHPGEYQAIEVVDKKLTPKRRRTKKAAKKPARRSR